MMIALNVSSFEHDAAYAVLPTLDIRIRQIRTRRRPAIVFRFAPDKIQTQHNIPPAD